MLEKHVGTRGVRSLTQYPVNARMALALVSFRRAQISNSTFLLHHYPPTLFAVLYDMYATSYFTLLL